MPDTEIVAVEPISSYDDLENTGIEFVPEQALSDSKSLATGTAFLPRLQVNAIQSAMVTDGKLKAGEFGLVYSGDKAIDSGKEVVFLAISTRAKALMMPEGGNPIAFYDRSDPMFEKIAHEAAKGGMNGHMVGPEFLIYIPSQDTFALFYHSSKTLQNVASNVLQIIAEGWK